MSYKNKTYVAFDGDEDMRFYNLMKAWKQNDNTNFNFYDAHDLNTARDSSMEESIKHQLSIRLQNSKVFVLLIGERTKFLYKFVRWEIEQAINRELPIIAVNLNRQINYDVNNCPPILKNQTAIHVAYNPRIMQYALENWPTKFAELKNKGNAGPFQYNIETYKKLGIL